MPDPGTAAKAIIYWRPTDERWVSPIHMEVVTADGENFVLTFELEQWTTLLQSGADVDCRIEPVRLFMGETA